MKKFTFIGAGSLDFTKDLVRGISGCGTYVDGH